MNWIICLKRFRKLDAESDSGQVRDAVYLVLHCSFGSAAYELLGVENTFSILSNKNRTSVRKYFKHAQLTKLNV